MKVVTRGRPVARGRKAPVKQANSARQTTVKKPATRAAKTPVKTSRVQTTYDVSKAPTGYHKHFAKWLRDECGYDPNEARTKSSAFLAGVSFATASRPLFMKSDFLAEWREETGQAKRGPKAGGRTRKVETPVEDEDEFDVDEDEFDEDSDDEDEFDNSDEYDEQDEDEFEDDESDEDEFEDEVEEEPEPPKRGRTAASRKAATTHGASGQRRTSAPSKKPTTRGKAKADEEDDEFVF